jgi:hypothetical protein
MVDTPLGDKPEIRVDERIVVHKYDGNYTEEEIDRLKPEPVETIVLHNGKIVEHTIHKEE